jgi:hypothetical protein
MLSEENLLHLTSTLASIDTAVSKIAKDDGIIDEATRAMANINTAAIALESAAKAFDQAATTVTKDFSTVSADASTVLRKLDPILDDATTAMANVNATVAEINTTITPAATRAFRQVGNTATDFQVVMSRLQQLLAQIEQDPSRFVYQQPPPVER